MGGTIAKIMAGTMSRLNTKTTKARVTKVKAEMGKDGKRNQDAHRMNSRTAKGRLRGGSLTGSPSNINKGGRTSRTSRGNNNIATLGLVLLLVRSSNNKIAIPDLVLLLVSSSNSNRCKRICIREKKMRWTCMMPRHPLLPL